MTDLELEFLGKDGIEVKVSDWKLIWKALIKMHDLSIFRVLIKMGEKLRRKRRRKTRKRRKVYFVLFAK